MSTPNQFLPGNRWSYDLSNPGDYRYFKFIYLNLSQQDMTLSSSTNFARVSEAFDGTTRTTACEFDTFVTNSTTATILHEGNNTAFDEPFISTPDFDAIVQDLQFNFAVGLNVTGVSAGSFNIDSVTIRVRSYRAPGALSYEISKTEASGFTAMTADGQQVFVIQDTIKNPFRVFKGGIVETQITINETTGTGTRQVGIIPVFPYQATGLKGDGVSGYRVLWRVIPNQNTLLGMEGGLAPPMPGQLQYVRTGGGLNS